ncbi:MAG: histidine phosphatase family protein [Bacteroidota bacterium]
MDIFLARHGETEYNRIKRLQGRGIDQPLNETGRQQASAISTFFKNRAPHKIIASSLKRSLETAEMIAQEHQVNVSAYSDLEEMSFGVYEGRWIKHIQHELKSTHEKWAAGQVDHALEGGESPKLVLQRSKKAFLNILNQSSDEQRLLFVLHGRLLRILLADLLGHGLANMHKIPHSNGALYHLRWTDNQAEAVDIHITSHLT